MTDHHFPYVQELLHAEQVCVAELAQTYGTPLYVYSQTALIENYQRYAQAFGADTLICYAMKANSNLGVLKALAACGAGFDIVSGGELERVLAAGGQPGKVVFSGVGKSQAEMRFALEAGIHCFNVESASELEQLHQVAVELGQTARISFRVNPNVDAKTHPYISTGLQTSKFGVAMADAPALYRRAQALAGIEPVGIDCHIGSQILDVAPLLEALDHILDLVDSLKAQGIALEHIDMGGGLGVLYEDADEPADFNHYCQTLQQRVSAAGYRLVLEPGRSIVADAGMLITQVTHLKSGAEKNFAVVDAAMNDLLRPALYGAWQRVLPVRRSNTPEQVWDVVGPVCESGDFLAKDRSLALVEGDLLAVMQAGAYGFVMASNYNTRPRAAEVMVAGERSWLIRRRETVADLLAAEMGLD